MSQPWSTLVAVGGGLLLLWAGLVLTLWLLARRDQRTGSLREALRLLPDVVRLLRALAADPDLPRGVRLRLVLLLGYLLMPLDLVPDVIPVVGWADDVVVVALALRSVVRRAGPGALDRHWPGTPDGLAVVRRLAGLPTPPATGRRPGSGSDTGRGPGPGSDTGRGPGPGSDTGRGPGPGSDTGRGPGSDTGRGPGPGSDTDTGSGSGPGSGSASASGPGAAARTPPGSP
ncbi:hypothetical protein GCM10009719_37500 [Nocardioides kribbensis]|uniref:YkvA family protein n=1 Tax=Nocardioides kribbensis TaxID=305517 RepID=UPI0031DCBF4F